ncbi:MAG: hypothetical protein EBV14_02960, partial [Actinobacteria bacterium]|nr:hypothetical protein [Actinomycetota bacterium]
YVPNDKYWGDDKPATKELVMVPMADDDTQVAAIKAGEVDFVYPQFYGGIEEAYSDPNITLKKEFGGDYEGFYFQAKCGPFANPIFRAAFSKSIDRDALFQQIYVPLGGESPLQCGPIVRRCRSAPDRKRLDQGRRRLLDRPIDGRSSGCALDHQHGQHPSREHAGLLDSAAQRSRFQGARRQL